MIEVCIAMLYIIIIIILSLNAFMVPLAINLFTDNSKLVLVLVIFNVVLLLDVPILIFVLKGVC